MGVFLLVYILEVGEMLGGGVGELKFFGVFVN